MLLKLKPIFHENMTSKRSRVKFFISTGVKHQRCTRFESKWSHIICLCNTLSKKNSFDYIRRFVAMVTQQNSLLPIESYWHWLNSMYLPCFYGNKVCNVVTTICFLKELCKANNMRPFSFISGKFFMFDPCRDKMLTLWTLEVSGKST